ncbi:MAG: class II fructose-bisphosphate aldolase [Candidatus Sabulitectum sp.]|nr:class II fructose-bisphosphate aldolase [Candidatus Sabulitectum sp.]
MDALLYQRFLDLRPLNVIDALPESRCALVSGRDIARVAEENHAIVMACNIRNPLSALGILTAAKKADSFVLLELAKSEATYTGVNFINLPSLAMHYSSQLGDHVVYSLHMDHFAIKSPDDLMDALKVVPNAIAAGWTSVAIDASHNHDWENLMYTRDLAMHIPPYIGLETEVGEIKGAGVLTTVEEAEYYIGGLNAWGIFPDFLAISNGSKHGTYDTSAGEDEGIDLQRTRAIADAIAKYGVTIAQHGISGTPLDKVGHFREYGINKGNVGTLWQNILFGLEMDPDSGNAVMDGGSYVKRADKGIPTELWNRMVKAADAKGWPRNSGNYKKLNLPFHSEIMALPGEYRQRILDETEKWALRFFEAFGSVGLGSEVIKSIVQREDWNSTPVREIVADRGCSTAANAPDGGTAADDGKDYSD